MEGIAIPKFESSKLWETIVLTIIIIIFMTGISVFMTTLSETDLEIGMREGYWPFPKDRHQVLSSISL